MSGSKNALRLVSQDGINHNQKQNKKTSSRKSDKELAVGGKADVRSHDSVHGFGLMSALAGKVDPKQGAATGGAQTAGGAGTDSGVGHWQPWLREVCSFQRAAGGGGLFLLAALQ